MLIYSITLRRSIYPFSEEGTLGVSHTCVRNDPDLLQ